MPPPKHVKQEGEAPARVAGSIRDLDAQLEHVRRDFLGQSIPPIDGTGAMKQRVVHVLSPICSPRFSKYSGIHEWNNCICLFVNVGDKNGNCYDSK